MDKIYDCNGVEIAPGDAWVYNPKKIKSVFRVGDAYILEKDLVEVCLRPYVNSYPYYTISHIVSERALRVPDNLVTLEQVTAWIKLQL